MSHFVTWGFLSTFAGCVAAVTLITQFLKAPLDSMFPQVSTRIWALLISFAVLLAVEGVNGRLNLESIVLCVINAFVVAVSAMGSYDFSKRMIGGKE